MGSQLTEPSFCFIRRTDDEYGATGARAPCLEKAPNAPKDAGVRHGKHDIAERLLGRRPPHRQPQGDTLELLRAAVVVHQATGIPGVSIRGYTKPPFAIFD